MQTRDRTNDNPSFAERYRAAQAREKPRLDSGVTAKMWQGTQNLIKEFFPEAAAKIAREQGISQERAEAVLRERMKDAADRCREEYVRENGYGTIVTVLAVAEELAVVRKVLENAPPETTDTWIDWQLGFALTPVEGQVS